MAEKVSLLDMLNAAASRKAITKTEFGKIMHDPNSTDEEIAEALRLLKEANGYENLGD